MDFTGIESHYSGQSSENPSKCAGCIKCSRKTTSFLLSHIGLLSLVVGYCIMGAFIFEEVELENELETKRNMKTSRLAVSDTIWDITAEMKYLHQDKWKAQVTESLKKFEKSLIIAIKEKGWDGKEEEDTVSWDFAGALFYSITVITTIGYGHMAPKTPVGKVVTIVYAVVGIPITVVCWSNIGDAMANAFRFSYWKVCCYVYTKKTKKRRRRMLSRHRAMSMRVPPMGGGGGGGGVGGGGGMSRRRSVRSRVQRPSQRSADSKPSTITGESKLTTPTFDTKLSTPTFESKLTTPTFETKPPGLNFETKPVQALTIESKPTTLGGPAPTTSQIPGSTGGVLGENRPVATPQAESRSSTGEEEKSPAQKQYQLSEPLIIEAAPLRDESDDVVEVCPETPKDVPDKSSDVKHDEVKPAHKMTDKAGERMKEVSSSVLNKIRSAKKSANLSLDFESKKVDASKVSPETEAPPGVITEDMKGLNARARAILRAEKDSQKSQNSGNSGISNGSPGQTFVAVPSIARGQRVARIPDEYDDQSYYEDYYYAESDDDLDDVSKRPVPILLSILLVVAYIVGGAFLFQMWEGWSFLDSAYFCFITLTTIGFGDFTPDQNNDNNGEQRIALCSIYLLFGIAMIAMCFNLVQVEVINSVKGVGKMLGIIKDNDDEEDY